MAARIDRYGNPMSRADFSRGGRQIAGPSSRVSTGRGWFYIALGSALLVLGSGAGYVIERTLIGG